MDADAPGAEHRLEMVRLAAEALGGEVRVSDMELRRQGRSYTLETLRQIKGEHPGDRLYLLLGTDMFLTFQHLHVRPHAVESLAQDVAVDGVVQVSAAARQTRRSSSPPSGPTWPKPSGPTW